MRPLCTQWTFSNVSFRDTLYAFEMARLRQRMKRSYAVAFQKDALARLPKECEGLITDYLSVTDLARGLALTSKRMRDLAYEEKNWSSLRIIGMRNQQAQRLLYLHGRKMQSLALYGMRISRAVCRLFKTCTRLESLDLTGIWKSTAIDCRFVSSIAKLPLKRLLFGHNEVRDEGFHMLCKLVPSLEELDFNSSIVSARALYNICMLKNLRSVCLRSCANANEDVLRSICRLEKLDTLQLSFLPMLHCNSLRHLFSKEYGMVVGRLKTLVLNGMYVDRDCMRKISSLRKLKVLSLCHPTIKSKHLEEMKLPSLELLTVFCASEIENFQFLRNLPALQQLCLYRCAFSKRSLMHWARRRPNLSVRVFGPRPLFVAGIPSDDDEEIDYRLHKNITRLQLIRRPYPMHFS